MKEGKGYFYILSNKRKNVLYAGSTKDLIDRIKEHRKAYQKYNVGLLIYYEIYEHIEDAKNREKQVKGWKRERKIILIESKNKQWKDLYGDLIRDPSLASLYVEVGFAQDEGEK